MKNLDLEQYTKDHAAATTAPQAVHPLGARAKVLLTSVFGPYGQDDEYGSRQMNPMELYHNQVTRTQGAFSLRMFHRSWGIMLIQANIEAPCTLLDFPTLDRFVEEIRTQQYDVIGITSILPNLAKVEKMCELIRQYQPGAMIVIGGHIANMPGLGQRDRRRSRGQGGRRGLVSPLPGRRTGPPHPPPGGGLRHWHAQHGRRGAGPAGRRGGHAHPLGRLPVGLQLLLHLRHVRRQRQVGQLLPDRRRAVRRHVPTGARHEGLLLLRHGRKLPSLSKAGPAPPGADASSTTRLGRSTSSAPPTSSAPTASSSSSAWASPGCGWASRAATASTANSKASTPSRWSATCSRTASACWARRSSAWKTTRRRTSTRPSSTPPATTPTSTSSCSTRPSPARRCTPSFRPRGG